MQQLVITSTPNLQKQAFPPKKKQLVSDPQEKKLPTKPGAPFSMAVNLKLELRTRRRVTDVAFIRCVWLTVGDIKTCEVRTMQSTTKMEYGVFCFCAAAHFKDPS